MRKVSLLAKLVALPVLLLVALALPGGDSSLGDEEYVILSLAIKDAIGDARSPEVVVLDDETSRSGDDYALESILRGSDEQPLVLTDAQKRTSRKNLRFKNALQPDTIENYNKVNQHPVHLEGRFDLPVATLVVKSAELLNLPESSPNAYWDAFREKYPHAIGKFFISRPGFNSQHNQALVYVDYTTGPVGGDGSYVLLQKENGVWKVSARLLAWIS